MREITKKVIVFIMFGCLYTTIEVFYRGYSHPLMFLVAGLLTLLVDPINNRISWDMPLPIQMIIATILAVGLELTSGLFALHVLNTRIWDYRNLPGNMFDGLVCPQFTAIWFILCGILIILVDCVNYYWLGEKERPYYRLWFGSKKVYLPERRKQC